jgi:GT2 family glycosyltransferase
VSNLDYSPFEIVVVDNGSIDGSAAAIKNMYPSVHLIESSINLGAAGGRNLGITYTYENFNNEYFLFLDNDIVIEKNALTEMVKSYNSSENVGIVTPKCFMTNYQNTLAYAGGLSVNLFTGAIRDIGGGQIDKGQYDESVFVDACGGLFLISKKVLKNIGNFDNKFNPYGWEDIDFSLRAGKKNYKILYNPKAIIYHKGGKASRTELVSEYESSKVKNYFYLLKKHAGFLHLLSLTIILPLRLIAFAVHELLQGKFDVLLYQFKGIKGILKK